MLKIESEIEHLGKMYKVEFYYFEYERDDCKWVWGIHITAPDGKVFGIPSVHTVPKPDFDSCVMAAFKLIDEK